MHHLLRKFRDGLGRKVLDTASAPIARVERKVDLLEYFSHGSRATYMGNNRLLVKIVVANANIAYLVEADDLLIVPWFVITGTYELSLTNYFLSALKNDSHCLDIGSNFGFFTCLFARFANRGKVIAVEADRHVFELCRDNIAINGFHSIGTAIHAAANETAAPLTLHRRNGRSGNTSIIAAHRDFTDMLGEEPAVEFTIQGLRADDLLPQFDGRIDFIKIDIEGAEPGALRGARQIIATNPQLKIIMEWSPGQIRAAGSDPSAFLDELSDQGLLFFDIETRAKMSKKAVLASDYMAGLLIAKQP